MTAKSPFSHKLIHVGILVRDMDKAIKRLESLGIGPFKTFDPGSLPQIKEDLPYKGKPLKRDSKICVASVGEIGLDIIEPGEGGSPWREFLDNRGEGIHHIAFAVDDLDKEIANFTEQGASVMIGTRWEGGGGVVYLDLGVGGIIIELEQK